MIRNLSSMQQTANLRQLVTSQKIDVNKASMELATGLKQDVFSASGASPAQSMEFRSRMAANDAYKVANQTLATQLDVTSQAMSDVREIAGDFVGLLVSGDVASTNRGALRAAAQGAMEAIVNKLNTSYNGGYLFSGTSTEQKPLELEADNTVTYNGGAQTRTSRIDDDTVLNHGIGADHPALQGIMAVLTSVLNTDMAALDPGEFQEFQAQSARDFAGASEQVTALQARLGDNQARLEKMITRQTDMTRIYSDAILDIESVLPEEAAVRLEGLTIQLQATFQVTARMSELSFLNYMR